MGATSGQGLTVQRPRFQVEGEARPQLDSDLLSMEVRADEQGITTLEARFNNQGPAEEGGQGGYRWFDGQVLQLGRQIKVAAGEQDNEAMLFTGAITAMRARFTPDRGPELIVRAEDAASLLRLGQRTRVYENETDKQIADRVAQDHSLTPSGDPQGPTHTQLWQINQTDLGFLRARARAVDARIGVADQTLKFEPRRGAEEDPISLTTLNELLTFEATVDLAHQRTEVQVHGWSVADKDGIHESATSSVVSAESAGGRTGPSVLEDLGWAAVEHHHLEVPSTTDEARTLAETMLKRRARRFVVANGMTSGTPKMRVGSRINVSDAGPLFSGHYTVASLRHTFDQALGLRTYFVAERVDLGGQG